MENVKESKWFYVLISVLIAVTFWLYVRSGEDPDIDTNVKNIPVELSGERILESQGLVITSQSHEAVTLSWKGTWSRISQLDNSNVSVTVDVSRITEPGTYDLSYTPNYPSTVAASTVSLQRGDPERITVTVSRFEHRSFEIDPVMKGSVAEGYKAGEMTVEPESVVISGTKEDLDRISQVMVILDSKQLRENFADELPLILLDGEGAQIPHEDLVLSSDNVFVSMPVVVVKEIPLTVEFVAGGGATEENVHYQIQPQSTITVSGPEQDMLHLEEISLGTINLAQVIGKASFERSIYLPAGLENISGLDTAKIEVAVEGLATKAYNVDNILLTNKPEGYDANLLTMNRTVVLRGPAHILDIVYPSQLRVVADLSELTAATGTYTVDADVIFYGNRDVGVIGEYSVVVNIAKPMPNQEE